MRAQFRVDLVRTLIFAKLSTKREEKLLKKWKQMLKIPVTASFRGTPSSTTTKDITRYRSVSILLTDMRFWRCSERVLLRKSFNAGTTKIPIRRYMLSRSLEIQKWTISLPTKKPNILDISCKKILRTSTTLFECLTSATSVIITALFSNSSTQTYSSISKLRDS